VRRFATILRSMHELWRPMARLAWIVLTSRVRRAIYEPTGEFEVAGPLSARVTVCRGECGIPYISAETWDDAAFALGFVHACDRLGQMEWMRRLATGTVAAVAGRLALPIDVAVRTVGYPQMARAYAERIDGETRQLLGTYAAGVNAAVARRVESGNLPVEHVVLGVEPRPWELLDTLALSRVACTDVSLGAKPLLTRIAAGVSPVLRRLLLPFIASEQEAAEPAASVGAEWGSNAWAVAGSRTADGKPLVAADPHVGLQAPALWYPAAMRIAQTDEAMAGLTVPGWPFFVLGRNRRVAWGGTNMLAESSDLFHETIEGGLCLSDGRRVPVEERRERIPVGGREETEIRIRRTPRGPLISDAPLLRRLIGARTGEHISLANPVERVPSDELTAFRRLNQARTVADVREALATYAQCALVFVAGDVDGHIGMFPAAALPVRRSPPRGTIRDGRDPRDNWEGVAFPCGLPETINPSEGYVANSNDLLPGADPERVGRLTCPPFRGDRLRELLAGETQLTLDRAAEIQRDCTCPFTAELVARMLPLLTETTGHAEQARRLLAAFDGRMEADSAPAAVAGVFCDMLRLKVFQSLLGDDAGARFARDYRSYPALLRALGDTERSQAKLTSLAEAGLRATAAYLSRHHGRPARWQWGRVVRNAYVTPLGRVPALGRAFRRGPYPARGTAHTVCQLRYTFDVRRARQAAYLGVTARVLMPLGADELRICVATGVSENPQSPRFFDQGERLHAGRHVTLALSGPKACGKPQLILHPRRGRRE